MLNVYCFIKACVSQTSKFQGFSDSIQMGLNGLFCSICMLSELQTCKSPGNTRWETLALLDSNANSVYMFIVRNDIFTLGCTETRPLLFIYSTSSKDKRQQWLWINVLFTWSSLNTSGCFSRRWTRRFEVFAWGAGIFFRQRLQTGVSSFWSFWFCCVKPKYSHTADLTLLLGG